MEICRLCMQCDGKTLKSIFSVINDVDIAHTITLSCSIQLFEGDGLPSKICEICVQEVQTVNAFIKKVRRSDTKLRNDVPQPDEKLQFEVIVIKTELSGDENDGGDHFEQSNNEVKYETDSDEDVLSNIKARIKKIQKANKAVSKKQRRSKRKRKSESECESEELKDNDSLDEKELEMFEIIDLPAINYICCGCFQYFETAQELGMHIEVHQKFSVKRTDTIFCDICKRRFNQSRDLEKHKKELKAASKVYECRKCKIRFISAVGRRRHAYRHPKTIEDKMKQDFGQILCCVTNCRKSYPSEDQLIKHSQEEHKINKRAYEAEDVVQKPSECPVCYKRFTSVLLLRRHRKRNSKPMNHQCATCGLKFRTRDVLLIHESNHTNKKQFECDICKKSFASNNAVKAHQRYHSNERPFICATCGAGFYQKALLVTHEYGHGSAPLPFQCEVCSKYYKTKGALVNHMRLHTGERPYPCRHCSMSFANHTTRQRHEMNHTGIKPYKCSFCDRTFTIKRLQVEHECSHTGIKPYKCSFCDKSFIRKRFQMDHESCHTGVKPYSCDLCKRSFSHQSGLRRHRLETHSSETENVSNLAGPSNPTQ
ncbi:gastrula zinc finger protein XlCGF26.1 isoform X2 [Aedes aegypti]|uniref:Zinc finger protein n=1 Tax=Aedes aegypti TaxID=7159 RepID=A0A6I8TXY0_AEDAE|nr:gastrula zinc finger protein XlCGF26.1 isoform X2 [Aedes aegypti]